MQREFWSTTAGNLNNLTLKQEDDSKIISELQQLESSNELETTVARIEIRCIGLNFADIFACLGLYSATPKGNFTPGLEFSGTITHLFKSKHDDSKPIRFSWQTLKVGDDVMGVTRFGAYSTSIFVPTFQLRDLQSFRDESKAKWTFEEGASFLCQALTAWYGISHLGQLELCSPPSGTASNKEEISNNSNNSNDNNNDNNNNSNNNARITNNKQTRFKNVLVQSAAGGVGWWSLNICLNMTATNRKIDTTISNNIDEENVNTIVNVIGTVGSSAKKDFLFDSLPVSDHVKRNNLQIIVRTTGAEFGTQVDNALKVVEKASDSISIKKKKPIPGVPNFVIPETNGNKTSAKNSGLDIVFDAIAGSYFSPSFNAMAPCSRYIIFGGADFMSACSDSPNWFYLAWKYLSTRASVYPLDMISENKNVMAFNLIWLWQEIDKLNIMLNKMEKYKALWWRPHIGKSFTFKQIPAALKYFQTGKSIGKVVVTVDQPTF